jgi:hypothetical protein
MRSIEDFVVMYDLGRLTLKLRSHRVSAFRGRTEYNTPLWNQGSSAQRTFGFRLESGRLRWALVRAGFRWVKSTA